MQILFGSCCPTDHHKNVVYILFAEKIHCAAKIHFAPNTILICIEKLIISLDVFLEAAKLLENATKRSDGCNKLFYNFIYILCDIIASRFTLHVWRAIWYLIRKTSDHQTISYSKFGRFLWCSMWWSHCTFTILTDSMASMTDILWTFQQQHSRRSGQTILSNEVFMKRFVTEFLFFIPNW